MNCTSSSIHSLFFSTKHKQLENQEEVRDRKLTQFKSVVTQTVVPTSPMSSGRLSRTPPLFATGQQACPMPDSGFTQDPSATILTQLRSPLPPPAAPRSSRRLFPLNGSLLAFSVCPTASPPFSLSFCKIEYSVLFPHRGGHS